MSARSASSKTESLFTNVPIELKIISSQQAQIQIRFQEQKQIGGEPIQIELFILNKIAHVVKYMIISYINVVKFVAICPAAGHSLK